MNRVEILDEKEGKCLRELNHFLCLFWCGSVPWMFFPWNACLRALLKIWTAWLRTLVDGRVENEYWSTNLMLSSVSFFVPVYSSATLFHIPNMNSIGFISGEYGALNTRVRQRIFSSKWSKRSLHWTGALSNNTSFWFYFLVVPFKQILDKYFKYACCYHILYCFCIKVSKWWHCRNNSEPCCMEKKKSWRCFLPFCKRQQIVLRPISQCDSSTKKTSIPLLWHLSMADMFLICCVLTLILPFCWAPWSYFNHHYWVSMSFHSTMQKVFTDFCLCSATCACFFLVSLMTFWSSLVYSWIYYRSSWQWPPSLVAEVFLAHFAFSSTWVHWSDIIDSTFIRIVSGASTCWTSGVLATYSSFFQKKHLQCAAHVEA